MKRNLARMLAALFAAAALTVTAASVTHASPDQDVIPGVFIVNGEVKVVYPEEGECYEVHIDEGDYVQNYVEGYENTYEWGNCAPFTYRDTFRPGEEGHAQDSVDGIIWTSSPEPPN